MAAVRPSSTPFGLIACVMIMCALLPLTARADQLVITSRTARFTSLVRGPRVSFEEKMAMLLGWAYILNRSLPAFAEATGILETEDSVIGRVIRRASKPR